MMITGRLTADACLVSVREKEVVRFRLVQNERFRDRGGGFTEEQTFYECAYWQQPAVVKTLRAGAIVELIGRLRQRAWIDSEGQARCELSFHVDHLKILGTVSYRACAHPQTS